MGFEQGGGMDAGLRQLIIEAEARYSSSAEFAYPTKGKEFAILTLREAIERCGKHMVGESPKKLWAMMDKLKRAADILRNDDNVARYQRALVLGQEALER